MNPAQAQELFLYDIWYRPWWHTNYFYFCSIFFAILLIIALIVVLKKYWFGRKKISYFHLALQDLHRLESATYSSDKTMHEAYFKVTMILKVYLSKRFQVTLLDKTDLEIPRELAGTMSDVHVALLKEFFDRSFQIKFAYDSVSHGMLKDDIEFARSIILQTNPEHASSQHP